MDVEQLEKPVAVVKISPPNVSQRNAKIDSLTGLSFIAVCLIFIAHTTSSADLPVFVRSFLASGDNGIILFFILSGFVLCYNYYDAFSTRFVPTLKSFFVARFARLYPLHFLLFLLFLSVLPISYQLQHFEPLLAQITLTQAWSSDPTVLFSYNSVSWAVSVVAFLYLCFPLLVLLLFKRATKIKHLCLIGFVAFSAIFLLATWVDISRLILVPSHNLSGVHHQLQTWIGIHGLLPSYYWVSAFPVTRLGDFILGCVAARIYVLQMAKPISPREQVLGVTTLLLSIAAVGVLMASSNTILLSYKFDAGYSLFFVLIIYTLARYVTPVSRFLSTKLLVLLGEASYAFYLLHLMLLTHGLNSPSLSAQLAVDLFFVMDFLLLVVAALGVHTYFEKPLRKRIRQVFASRASASALEPSMPTVVGWVDNHVGQTGHSSANSNLINRAEE